MPERIQLSRRRGWRLPAGTTSCSRPAQWGNPFAIGAKVISPGDWGARWAPYAGPLDAGEYEGPEGPYEIRIVGGRADAVALFIDHARHAPAWDPAIVRKILGGRDLACWCPLPAEGEPDICHAAALLDLAAGRRMTTPRVPHPAGGYTMHVYRCCNGCGEPIGDVTDEEVICAVDGRPLPDVRGECPRCSKELAHA